MTIEIVQVVAESDKRYENSASCPINESFAFYGYLNLEELSNPSITLEKEDIIQYYSRHVALKGFSEFTALSSNSKEPYEDSDVDVDKAYRARSLLAKSLPLLYDAYKPRGLRRWDLGVVRQSNKSRDRICQLDSCELFTDKPSTPLSVSVKAMDL